MLTKNSESDSNPPSNIEYHDLYQYITPPIPLIPKNKYTDDLPRSYFMML